MESLGKLRNAEDKFRNVGVAHDLSPKQREDVRRALQEARQRQGGDGGNAAGNQKFRVVGQGSRLRVLVVGKK